MRYYVTVGVFQGHWWEASQIYRKWAINNAEWTENGHIFILTHFLTHTPLENRTDIPSWFSNIGLWVNTGWEGAVLNWTEGDPDLVQMRLSTLHQLFNTTIAAHWYCWHEIPFDTGKLVKG